MTDRKKPKLKLVKGKAKPRHRMTAKQSKFIDCIIGIGENNPMTYTDAYREAYDCEKMSDHNIRKEAHRLFHNPHLTPLYEERSKQYEETQRTLSLGRSGRIISRLEEEASDFEHGTSNSRVRALQLLGQMKTIKLFSTDVDLTESKSSDQIKQELEEKLKTLLGE